jgi:hypothetical protein
MGEIPPRPPLPKGGWGDLVGRTANPRRLTVGVNVRSEFGYLILGNYAMR